MSTITHNLQQLAISSPNNPAIIGSNITLSWSALYAAVGELTTKLNSHQTLGLYLDNSPAWVVSDLAAIEANIRIIPLPTFFSAEQLRHAITDGDIDLIITDNPERLDALSQIHEHQSLDVTGQSINLLYLKPPVIDSIEQPARASKITYTSGTTGTPKGVILGLEHIETVTRSLHDASQASAADRALVMLPLSTLLENIGSVYVPLLAGAQIIVPDPVESGLNGSSGIDIQAFATMLNKYQPTTMILPPQLLKLVVGLAAQGNLPDSFRYIAVGGAPVGSALLAQAKQLGLPVYQGYGLSEACSVVAVNTPDQQRVGSVGKPLPHSHVRISEDGEITVSGTVYEGYLNQATPEDAELITGDLGYLDDDGYLYITGRSKNVIITAYGRNISPEWLESELQAHTDIAQAAVFGSGQAFLTAVLVPSQTMHLTHQGNISNLLAGFSSTLKEINSRLPDYAHIAEFIVAEQPFTIANNELTTNGRPRREVIEQHYSKQISEIYEDHNERIL